MAKLGESSGWWTWAQYHQWPFYAGVLGIGLMVVGFFINSLIGALMGLVSGVILGCIGGIGLGPKRSMFPVVLEIWLSYSSGDFEPGMKYPARVVTQSFGDGTGFVERRVVEYLAGTRIRQLPNYSLPVWKKDGDIRKLKVLMIDSNYFAPIITERGAMKAKNVPVYATDETGKIIKFKLDEKGEYAKTPEDKFIEDENGKPMILRYEDVTIFDPNVVMEDDRLVTVPRGSAAKLDNWRAAYTQAVRIAYEFNTIGGFWEKYGKEIIAVVTITGLIIVSWMAYDNFSRASAIYAGNMREAALIASQNELVASQNFLQGTMIIAKGLESRGIVVNITDITINRSVGTAPGAPEPTPVPIHIPFIG